jgi:hypothetical protein
MNWTPNEAVEKVFSWPHFAVNKVELQGSNADLLDYASPMQFMEDWIRSQHEQQLAA